MKQDYFYKLTELFKTENFDENTYIKIIQKYEEWYDKLLDEGKSDEEIQTILKSPEDIVTTFVEKFSTQKSYSENIDSSTDAANITTDAINSKKNESDTPTESDPKTILETSSEIDDKQANLISRTNKNGKTHLFKKRSFAGSFMYFILFVLVSFICLPILTSLFSAALALSFAALLLFYSPVYYLAFVSSSGAISYFDPHFIGSTFFHDTVNYVNTIIEYMNQFTTFHFDIFLSTILVSIFALALLILFLFILYQMVKLFMGYFTFFFNKITLKRVKVK